MNYFNELSVIDIENIFSYCDKDGHLLYALVCKDFKEILTNKYKKLTLTTKYFTSSLSLCKYAHKYFNKGFDCINNIDPNFSLYGYKQCSRAAEIGCHLCLAYSHNMGCSWDTHTAELASKNNNLICIIYCIKYGCPINEMTSYWAAVNGNLDILKFCFNNNIKWYKKTTLILIKHGYLNCLKYVVNHGCLWNKVDGLETAIFYDQQHIINWINEN